MATSQVGYIGLVIGFSIPYIIHYKRQSASGVQHLGENGTEISNGGQNGVLIMSLVSSILMNFFHDHRSLFAISTLSTFSHSS